MDRGVTLDASSVEEFIARYGSRANHTLSLLGKVEPFVTAIQTEAGQLLLKDDMERHEFLLRKAYNEEATAQEMAEFRYLKRRLHLVAERISLWQKGVEKVTKS